jgi:hypothetical protein
MAIPTRIQMHRHRVNILPCSFHEQDLINRPFIFTSSSPPFFIGDTRLQDRDTDRSRGSLTRDNQRDRNRDHDRDRDREQRTDRDRDRDSHRDRDRERDRSKSRDRYRDNERARPSEHEEPSDPPPITEDTQGKLPPNWELKQSKSHADKGVMFYYYNSETHESTWQRPVSLFSTCSRVATNFSLITDR